MTLAVHEPALSLDPETVCWVYDPWIERPRVAWTAAIVALVLCAIVVSAGEPLLVSLGLCLFCVGAFAPALTRVECRIEAAGVARRGWLGWERRDWRSIRRMDRLPAGVMVSPYDRRHILDAARGLVLPMPAAKREMLTRLVAEGMERTR